MKLKETYDYCEELIEEQLTITLKETLEKLRELISGTNENVDWRDECNVSYVNGYDDCLKSIDDICSELENL